MPLQVSSTCAHHQEVKIALHSLWYHHTYRSDDTRGCVMQFWPPDDEHMCSKHVEAWHKLIVKQIFCASSCLITETNILRCMVSKTSKFIGPCIANIFSEYKQQDGTFLYLLFFCKTLCIFQTIFVSIIRSSELHIQRRHLSDKYLTLYVQFWAPNDGRKTRLKHV